MTEKELMEKTDPYGGLSYIIGDEDDFWCFDYYIHGDKVVIHAVVNSETGSFIYNVRHEIVPYEKAFDVAAELTDEAIDWMAEGDIEHDYEGWNQDPLYFLRSIANDLEQPKRNLSETSLRYGGDMVDKWLAEKYNRLESEWVPKS